MNAAQETTRIALPIVGRPRQPWFDREGNVPKMAARTRGRMQPQARTSGEGALWALFQLKVVGWA